VCLNDLVTARKKKSKLAKQAANPLMDGSGRLSCSPLPLLPLVAGSFGGSLRGTLALKREYS